MSKANIVCGQTWEYFFLSIILIGLSVLTAGILLPYHVY